MGIREKLSENRGAGVATAVGFIVLAGLFVAWTFWPQKQANLDLAYYTDDNGKTWFPDSTFRVAPFDHNGKTAVVAHVYSYANGSKEFCAYLARFTPEAKSKLEAALADAAKAGKPPGSLWMWTDRGFMTSGVEVRKPTDTEWVSYNSPKANAVFAVKSPDGSTVDESFVK